MSSWVGTARSNYFRVKNIEAFKAAIATATAGEVNVDESETRMGAVALFSQTEYGDWPSSVYDEKKDEYVDANIEETVIGHLKDGEVAVFKEAGAEKMRYVTGRAVAVNNKGKRVVVDISDIYRLAARRFKVPQKRITLAQY